MTLCRFVASAPTRWRGGPRRASLVSCCLLALLVPGAQSNAAENDHIILDETVISGNAELPRVLYILPWRLDAGQTPNALPPAVRLETMMKPLHPQAYRREIALRELAASLGNATAIQTPKRSNQ